MKPAAVVLVAISLLVGCRDFGRDEEPKVWHGERPSVLYTSHGFTWGVYGPWPYHIRDDWGSLAAGLVSVEDVGLALEEEAKALAAKYGFDESAVLATIRPLRLDLVDDYLMDGTGTGSSYVGGMTDSGSFVILALWSRKAGTSDPSSVPSGVWLSRPPDGGSAYWRYTGLRLVPAGRHEFGHIFTGNPGFEH
jgi:hypothetical protein